MRSSEIENMKMLPSDDAENSILKSGVVASAVTASWCTMNLLMPPSRNGCSRSWIWPESEPDMKPESCLD